MKNLITSIKLVIIITVLTGVVYPLIVTGVSQFAMNRQANGSIIVRDGSAVGSELIGQSFTGDKYFHSRPSVAGKDGYDPLYSGGSNLSPSNPDFIYGVVEARKVAQKYNMNHGEVPNDLIMSSSSSLDPDISVDAAMFQAGRVAKARGMAVGEVASIIGRIKDTALVGIIGEEKVNVLRLNLELDKVEK